MSQRQDKYIAQLLKANRKRVLELYREMRGGKIAHIGGQAALGALRTARDAVLLELAEKRNLACVDWEHEEEAYDYGDLPEREQKRLEEKLERGFASIECYILYVRDRDGDWQSVESLGMCWVESQEDRDMYVREFTSSAAEIKAALYRHRARDEFGEFSRRWVPGHYAFGE